MTDQERLSEAYSSLKVKYALLKEQLANVKIAHNNQIEVNDRLIRQMGSLQDELQVKPEEAIHVLPKKSVNGAYVSLLKYNKQVALTDHFIALYHKEKDKNKQ